MPKKTKTPTETVAKPEAKPAAKATAKPAVKRSKKPADKDVQTQPERDRQEAEENAGGRRDVEKAPPAAQPTPEGHASSSKAVRRKVLDQHPVEKAKEQAREHGEAHLKEVVGDGTNMTATQKKAVQDQRDEIALEKQAPAEPARGVEHSVGTERKEGIRTAPQESERK